jgi:hypothetical protein
VPRDRSQPRSVLARPQQEPADHPLAALVIAIQQIDCHPLGCRDPRADVVELRLGRITERALPEREVTAGDVEVASEPAESVERRTAEAWCRG